MTTPAARTMTALDLWRACCKADMRRQFRVETLGPRTAPVGFAFRTAIYDENGYTVTDCHEATIKVSHNQRRVCAIRYAGKHNGQHEWELYYGASHPLCLVAWVGRGEPVTVEGL